MAARSWPALVGFAAGVGATYAAVLLGRVPAPAPAPPMPKPASAPAAPPATVATAARPVAIAPPVMLAHDARHIVKYGFPSTDNIVVREGYVLAYDRRTRNAYWTLEHLTADKLKGGATRTDSQFREDPGQPAMFRARLADYAGSGFDRGHLVPAGDNRTSQKAMDDTFFLTNISPQVGVGFNRNYWARFEQFVRNLTRDYADVYVATGPLYLPRREADGKHYVRFQVIGEPPNVAVPTHFFKVVLAERGGQRYAAAFVMPNAPIDDGAPLQSFEVPVEQVERSAGLVFFGMLDRAGLGPLCKTGACILPSPDFYKADKAPRAKM